MSSLYSVSTGNVSCTAATALIPLEIAPAATRDIQLIALDVTFDTVFSATYPLVELCTYSTVGSGGTAPTPTKYGENQNVAALTVARINDTTPPGTIAQLYAWYWSAASYLWPLGRELELLQSGKYCVRVTSPTTGHVAVNAIWAE